MDPCRLCKRHVRTQYTENNGTLLPRRVPPVSFVRTGGPSHFLGRAGVLAERDGISLLHPPPFSSYPLTSSLPLPPLSRSSDEEGGAIWRKNRPFRHEDKKAFPAVLCYSRKVTTQIESFTAAPSLKKQNFADWNCRVHDYGSARALLLSAPQTLPPSLQTPQRRILPSPLLSLSTPHAVAFG